MKKDSSRGYLPWPFVQRPDGLREWGTPLNDLNLIAFETSGSHVRYFGDHFWRMHAEEGHQISMLLSLALQSYTTLWGDSMMIRHIAETMNWDDNEEFRTFIMAYVSRVIEADARFQARVEGITRFMAGKLIAHFQSRVENSVAFAEKGIDILHQYEEVVGDVSNWEPTMASRLLAICVDREASLAGLSDDDAVEAELLGEEE
uniref:Uncharacterized protein n=1 Tax=viral metagenome TaxID=1070528 RepID=A0A2V0RM65_9ZZZZ